jgi:hypothetical protein
MTESWSGAAEWPEVWPWAWRDFCASGSLGRIGCEQSALQNSNRFCTELRIASDRQRDGDLEQKFEAAAMPVNG